MAESSDDDVDEDTEVQSECDLYSMVDFSPFNELECTAIDNWSVGITKKYTVLKSKDEVSL